MNNLAIVLILMRDTVLCMDRTNIYLLLPLLMFSLVPFIGKAAPTGQSFSMDESANFNIRFDGPMDEGASNQHSGLGYFSLATGDVNNDGEMDLLVGNRFADPLGRPEAGSLYIIDSSILEDAAAIGSTLDLSDPDNYSIRILGAEAGDSGQRVPQLVDLDGDEKLDLSFAAAQFYNSTSTAGHVYVLYNDLIGSYSGTGNTLDLTDPASWNIRFDGQAEANIINVTAADIDGDGETDLAMQEFVGAYPSDRGIFVIYHDLFSAYSGTGNVVSLTPADTANYNLYISENDTGLIVDDFYVADLNGNDEPDMVITAPQVTGYMYVLFDDLIAGFTGTGNQVELEDPSNYNVVFVPTWYLGASDSLAIGDVFDDGTNDIVVGDLMYPLDPTSAGAVYVIPNDIIVAGGSSTGNTVSLEGDTAYSIRFDGAEAGDEMTQGSIMHVADMDNNGKNDLVIDASAGHANSTTDSEDHPGKVFVIFDSILAPFATSTGDVLDLAASTSFNIRYDGANPGDWLGATGLEVVDMNDDNQKDLIMASWGSDENGTDTGSLYLIYYFPHEITLDPVFSDAGLEAFDVTGRVEAPDNVTHIELVQWGHQRSFGDPDSEDFEDIWHDCIASDGTFDSNDEPFTCHHEALDIDEDHASPHTVFFRARDSKGIYTAIENYPTETYVHDSAISDVEVTADLTEATIEWSTQAPATSTLEWGTTETFGTASSTSATSTSHTYTIPTISCITYYYRISATDVAGNTQQETGSFESAGCPEAGDDDDDQSSSGGGSSHRHGASESKPTNATSSDSGVGTLLVPTPSNGPGGTNGSTTCPYFLENLKIGMQGEGVSKIQAFLKAQSFFIYPTITGYFGPITEAGVKAFQAAHAPEILTPLGLTAPTGWWYEFTRRKANGLMGCGS